MRTTSTCQPFTAPGGRPVSSWLSQLCTFLGNGVGTHVPGGATTTGGAPSRVSHSSTHAVSALAEFAELAIPANAAATTSAATVLTLRRRAHTVDPLLSEQAPPPRLPSHRYYGRGREMCQQHGRYLANECCRRRLDSPPDGRQGESGQNGTSQSWACPITARPVASLLPGRGPRGQQAERRRNQ